jgi:hypothetical protein
MNQLMFFYALGALALIEVINISQQRRFKHVDYHIEYDIFKSMYRIAMQGFFQLDNNYADTIGT